ncbi:hypothetical protein [Mycolicibacterium thermoresistibile]
MRNKLYVPKPPLPHGVNGHDFEEFSVNNNGVLTRACWSSPVQLPVELGHLEPYIFAEQGIDGSLAVPPVVLMGEDESFTVSQARLLGQALVFAAEVAQAMTQPVGTGSMRRD